jgi:hypothetical protein
MLVGDGSPSGNAAPIVVAVTAPSFIVILIASLADTVTGLATFPFWARTWALLISVTASAICLAAPGEDIVTFALTRELKPPIWAYASAAALIVHPPPDVPAWACPICACANIALIAFAGSLALDGEAPVGADWAALVDVELGDEEEEFAPSNVKRLAADRPLKEPREESMSHLIRPGDAHRRGRVGCLAVMAKYEFGGSRPEL